MIIGVNHVCLLVELGHAHTFVGVVANLGFILPTVEELGVVERVGVIRFHNKSRIIIDLILILDALEFIGCLGQTPSFVLVGVVQVVNRLVLLLLLLPHRLQLLPRSFLR